MRLCKILVALGGCLLCGASAVAASTTAWQMGLPEPASPLARELAFFHNVILLPVITVITLLVLGLLLYVCWRFSAKRNPTPSTTTHNTALEVLWTGIPVIILALLFVPSMRVLYMADASGTPDMTLKITGHQWYWTYEYPDYENFGFDSLIIPEEELPQDKKHLYKMLTDNPVVLPTNRRIRLQITASDVLHNWSLSDFGVRIDAVPGRLNEAWVEIEKAGDYYGFCSELCGSGHAYMPITVKAVSPAEFKAWVETAKAQFVSDSLTPKLVNLADK